MKEKLHLWVREHRSFALFMVLMLVFRSSFADWNTVPTGSMKPTIIEGDRILVNKLAYDLKIPLTDISIYKLGEPQRGDIVTFNSRVADKKLVKRVIGLPGDVVELRDNHLVINGTEASYALGKTDGDAILANESIGDFTHGVRFNAFQASRLGSFGPVTVPEDHYLVMGDNRDNSADSRVIGFVPREEIAGRAKTVVLSLNYDNYYLPRADRFLHAL